jgi:hypothetical protein
VRALPEAFRNRDLRLLGLAWSSSTTAEATYLLVLGLFAYATGGALAVGLVGLLRMVPAVFGLAAVQAIVSGGQWPSVKSVLPSIARTPGGRRGGHGSPLHTQPRTWPSWFP